MEAMFGVRPSTREDHHLKHRSEVELRAETSSTAPTGINIRDRLKTLRLAKEACSAYIKDNVAVERAKAVEKLNNKRKQAPKKFKIGDIVAAYRPRRTRNGQPETSQLQFQGPYRITGSLGSNNFSLEHIETGRLVPIINRAHLDVYRPSVQVDEMKAAVQATAPEQRQATPPPPGQSSDDTAAHDVSRGKGEKREEAESERERCLPQPGEYVLYMDAGKYCIGLVLNQEPIDDRYDICTQWMGAERPKTSEPRYAPVYMNDKTGRLEAHWNPARIKPWFSKYTADLVLELIQPYAIEFQPATNLRQKGHLTKATKDRLAHMEPYFFDDLPKG